MATRKRTERRILERRLAKLARDKDALARHAPGGAPDRPIPVTSASVIEPAARATSCPLCDGPLRIDEHVAGRRPGADAVAGRRPGADALLDGLRVVHVTCTRCGVGRALHFRIEQPN